MTDNDPFGLQEWQSQKWSIFKRRLIRWGFPPAAIALIAGAGWFLVWFWGVIWKWMQGG